MISKEQITKKSIQIRDEFLNSWFDRTHGIETSTEVPLSEMDIEYMTQSNARRYQGTHYHLFQKVFRTLNRDWGNYTFVDFGAGKGRAMIMAALWGFKKVIGIEFAKDIGQSCLDNLNHFGKTNHEHKNRFDLIYGCASEFIPATSPNLYFLFNPFDGVILEKVLENIRNSKHYSKEDLFIYINPRRDFAFHLFDFELILKLDHSNFNRVIHVYR